MQRFYIQDKTHHKSLKYLQKFLFLATFNYSAGRVSYKMNDFITFRRHFKVSFNQFKRMRHISPLLKNYPVNLFQFVDFT